MSTGGLCLGCGILPKILNKLRKGGAVVAYLRKGCLSPPEESELVGMIVDERVALLGAVSIAACLR
jgi:glucokinase